MPLNYANAYRNFLAQARKAEVDPETIDFRALYDPTLSGHEMKRVIKEVIGTPGELPEPVLGVPQRVWDQVTKRNEKCTVRLTRCLKQAKRIRKEVAKPMAKCFYNKANKTWMRRKKRGKGFTKCRKK